MAKTLCPVCGKRLAKRTCRSRNESICSRCCGITRSRMVCPADCSFATGSQSRASMSGRYSSSQRHLEAPKGPRRLGIPDSEIEEMVRCTVLMGDEGLPGEERRIYARRCFKLERKNRIVVAEGRDEDDNPCIFLHPDHVYRNGLVDSRLYRPGDDVALEVSWIGRCHIQVRRIDGDVKISGVMRIETNHGEILGDDGSWW